MAIKIEHDFALPIGFIDEEGTLNRNGVMRLATAADEILPSADPRVKQNPGYLTVLILSRVITKLGNVQTITNKVIENLSTEDFSFLQEFYNIINGKRKEKLEVTCPKCKKQFETEVSNRQHSINGSGITLPVLKRNNYFFGKLLTPTDLQTEQNYSINKQRLLNRTLFGVGVVNGLKVTADDSGNVIKLGEGFALDGYGREIVLAKPLSIGLNNPYSPKDEGKMRDLFVQIQYEEKKIEPIPLFQGETATENNMIVEGAKVEISLVAPDSSFDKIVLAQVTIKMEKGKILICSISDMRTAILQ